MSIAALSADVPYCSARSVQGSCAFPSDSDQRSSDARIAHVSDEHHSVAAALLVRDGRVLLCHRHPRRRWYPDVWDIPGGHIDANETPAAALQRELHEELGVMVQQIDEVPWRTLTPAADLTLNVWLVDRWDGEIENRAPDEHDEIAWFRPEEADQLNLVDAFLADLIRTAASG